MIAHQAIAQQAQAITRGVSLEQCEVQLPVCVGVKNNLAMVASLGDVMGEGLRLDRDKKE